MKPVFNIGDFIFWAATTTKQKDIECPDCAGDGALTVIMGDGTPVSVDCPACQQNGYDRPTGRITYYEHSPEVKHGEVSGIETNQDGVEYTVAINSCSRYRVKEDQAFSAPDMAAGRAKEIAAEYTKAALDKIQNKEKPTRTWAWNATYHRGCVKRAKKDLEYHEAKLAVAKLKSKGGADNEQ